MAAVVVAVTRVVAAAVVVDDEIGYAAVGVDVGVVVIVAAAVEVVEASGAVVAFVMDGPTRSVVDKQYHAVVASETEEEHHYHYCWLRAMANVQVNGVEDVVAEDDC